MSAVRGRDTKPELLVRGLLHALGYRYRLHAKGLPGRPDIIFTARRKAIFIHGCFWHNHYGCGSGRTPKTRSAFWSAKLATNKERDKRVLHHMTQLGWETLVLWECELGDRAALTDRITLFLGPPAIWRAPKS